METVRIYRLTGLCPSYHACLRAAQMEAAQIWTLCRDMHLDAVPGYAPRRPPEACSLASARRFTAGDQGTFCPVEPDHPGHFSRLPG